MGQCASEANGCSASKHIPHLALNPNIYYHAYNWPHRP
jgi:hypothetical protein